MKNIYTILMLILFAGTGIVNNVLAQADPVAPPEGIIYQAEARDKGGKIIMNENLDVMITILEDDAENGLEVWQRKYEVTTNDYGMFVLVIENGTNTTGNFELIEWAEHLHFLNVGVKKPKKTVYVDMGTTQLLSVPYALHAKTARTVLADETDPVYSLDPAASITDAGSGVVISINERAKLIDIETNATAIIAEETRALAAEATIATAIATKVDKETGKGLSTNDYTTSEKTKLAGIEDDAEVNVNADWNATGGDAQLLNKPTNVSEFTNDAGYLSSEADGSITNELNTSIVLNGTNLEVTDAGGTKSADLSSLITEGGLTNCDLVLNILIQSENVDNLVNAGIPILDLFNAGHGVGILEQNGVSEQDLTDAGLIGTVDDADGNTYKWVKIGDQVWMAENLAYNVPGSWAYGDDENNAATYGRLYDWATVMDGAPSSTANPSGVQGTCPSGWHLPSDAEWTQLKNYLSANGFSGNEGTALKVRDEWEWRGMGTDDFGFSGLPGGFRSVYDTFHDEGIQTLWWSATEYNTSNAYSRSIDSFGGTIGYYSEEKGSGLSVRCVRD